MKRLCISAALLVCSVFAQEPPAAAAQEAARTIEVHAKRFSFSPEDITLKKGETDTRAWMCDAGAAMRLLTVSYRSTDAIQEFVNTAFADMEGYSRLERRLSGLVRPTFDCCASGTEAVRAGANPVECHSRMHSFGRWRVH
jgi:hypothetical protein